MAIKVSVTSKRSGLIGLDDLREHGYHHLELKDEYLILSSDPVRLTLKDAFYLHRLCMALTVPTDYKISSGDIVKVHPFKACQACHKHLSNSVTGLCSQCRVKLGNEMKAPVIDNDEDDYEARKLWNKNKDK